MRGKQRAAKWYGRKGKVHRGEKVMSRVAKLLAAKQERDEAAQAPAAVAQRRAAKKAALKAFLVRKKIVLAA